MLLTELATVAVRLQDGPAIAAGVALGALLVLLLFFWWRSRSALVRRVQNATIRLEDHAPGAEQRGWTRTSPGSSVRWTPRCSAAATPAWSRSVSRTRWRRSHRVS